MWSRIDTRLNDHGSAAGVTTSSSVACCRRYLDPHLYTDGDGAVRNACVKKSTQRGGSSVYKALRYTLEQHVIDGGDDQSFEFFIHSNDEEICRILRNAVDVQK